MMTAGLTAGVLALGCSAPPSPSAGSNRPLAAAKLEPAPAPAHHHEQGHHPDHDHDHAAPPTAAAGLVRIADPGHVCMLSNRFLGEKTHVPVDVDGKTYFGCCANCAARIGERAEARNALDPVTGSPVDKAAAVLARDETNKVLYFESEETFARMQRERRQ